MLLSDEQAVGYPNDSELLLYLDRAVIYYSEQMIAAKDPVMLKQMEAVGCVDVPNDFVALAGQWPVEIRGRHMDYYGASPLKVMYFANLPLVSSAATGEIAIPNVAVPVILDLARTFALNRNEYDLTQDLKIIEVWQAGAKGARA
ncbi:hypothetical protein SDC9_171456 [bioreactor metagenome]|uniref:Uncharacterized protein n=2 Tax=root TaxID=1 RepID=A0A645GDH9_9ZZZZ